MVMKGKFNLFNKALLVLIMVMGFGVWAGAQISFDDFSGSEDNLVEMMPYFSKSAAVPGESYRAAVVITVDSGWHINSIKPWQDWLIPTDLVIDTTDFISPHDVVFPPSAEIQLLGEQMTVYDGEIVIFFQVDINKEAALGPAELPVSFTYQACNDKECRAPQTIETSLELVIGEVGEPVNDEVFSRETGITVTAEDEKPFDPNESEIQTLINKYGFWGYLLALGLAFVTGLLLSFSPCTYPMIPITVSIFAGQDRSVGRGFIMSLFYVGTMALIYGIMGLIVSLVGGVFGAWLASPPVVIGIAVVFVIFSLSMFGLYELQVPASIRNKLGTTSAGSGIGGAMVLGVVAALVVSPCVGPFVAGILLYIATAGSPVFGFLALFIFAIGLGTLYIIIGTFSSAINALPKAGMWMESVKKFFGFVLLLMAIYFLKTIIPVEITALLTALMLLGLGIFGGGLDRLQSDSTAFERLKKFIGILAFIGGVYLVLGLMITRGFILPPISEWLPANPGSASQTETELIAWETDLETGLARARQENKPVIIDTWATWCVNCRVLDKKTFGNPEVAAAMQRFVPLKIQLEKSGSPETIAFMQRFGLKQYSLPTTLLLDSSGNVKRIMKGVVKPAEMIAELNKVQ